MESLGSSPDRSYLLTYPEAMHPIVKLIHFLAILSMLVVNHSRLLNIPYFDIHALYSL